MDTKSILILGNYPPPYGGVPRHIEYLAPFLADKGWDVHVLSGGSSGTEHKKGITIYKRGHIAKSGYLLATLAKNRIRHDLKLMKLENDSLKRTLAVMSFMSMGRQIIEHNNISIISAYNLYSFCFVGACLSKEFKIPFVATNFGEIFSMKEYFQKNIERVDFICTTAAKLLAMSRHCADSYKILGLSPAVEVIPYGVDADKFSPKLDGSSVRNELGIDTNDNVVLFVGRLTKDMGLHTVLETIPRVLAANDNIKFVIVGQKGDLFKDAELQADRNKGKVFVVPNAPFDKLPLYYAAATIVIVPTQGERACGSLAAIEALAAGKPVIAANVGGIPEIVIHGEVGMLVPPDDANALAKEVLSLLQNKLLLEEMGKAARTRVEKYYRESQTDHKIEQLFSTLAHAYS